MSEDGVVRDNPAESRYELVLDDKLVGELLYRQKSDAVVLLHTEVMPELDGKGYGSTLVSAALDDIRARGLHVVAICPFVRAYIRRHSEYTDLVLRETEVSG